jgi:hypothetical protein
MKFLLIFLILVISTNIVFAGIEEDKIPLVTPINYNRSPEMFQNTKASATVWFGDLIGKADIGEQIRSSIAPFRSDLAKYYSKPGELDQFVNSLITEANRDIVRGDLTDVKVIQVNRFFGNKLIGNIVDRILEKEGVPNADRRKIWVNKILAPFNECVGRATNGYYAASHCMGALTSSVVPSAGVGLVYELSKDKLSGSFPSSEQTKFNADQAKIYRDCILKTKGDANAVMECAVLSMKNGILKATDLTLTQKINSSASSSSNAKSIKQKVMPSFNKCNDAVSAKLKTSLMDQFFGCIDQLTQLTGVELVKDKLLNTPTIKAQFGKAELDKLAADKALQFKKCTDDMIKKNIRIDGMLDVTTCENAIVNDVTYQVMLRTFKNSAKDMVSDPEMVSVVSEAGKRALDSCWNESQSQKGRDACIKSSVIVFAKHIAALKLDAAVPDSMKNKKLVISNSLNSLKDCLEKSLPTNISEANDTDARIAECSDKLTKNVALTVADSEVRLTLKGKMSEEEIDKVVAKNVTKEFASCLGPKPSDKQIDSCSDNLKVAVSEKVLDLNISQYMSDRPGIDLSKKRNEIKTTLINDLKSCLKTSKNKENCTDELQKDADRKIVLSFGRTELSVQLSTDQVPAKIKPIEAEFLDCTKTDLKGEALSNKLDECNKKFAIEFARTLGDIKLRYLLGKAIGSDELAKQEQELNQIIGRYNQCLDKLYKIKMEDGLTEKLSICTTDLEKYALGLVRQNLNNWMSTEQKDATTIAVKNEFAGIIPCLSVLLPSSPYSQSLQNNTDSVLKPVAALMAQYIEYSPENARLSLKEIISRLARDLNETGGTDKAKAGLLDLLYQNGALDQFIKSMVRGKVKDAFTTLSDNDLPKELREMLITKENFDTIFDSADGKSIRDFVHENILKPALIDGADMNNPVLKTNLEQVNNKVVKMLIMSPRFGDQIVKSGIQKQIDNMSFLTKTFAKVLYGKDNLVWEKVRTSEAGQAAEAFIKEKVLMPKFTGTMLSPEEEKKMNDEAERLVTEAVKKY